jgi:hypothetical protein
MSGDVALVWVAASWSLMKLRPAVARAPLPDYFMSRGP